MSFVWAGFDLEHLQVVSTWLRFAALGLMAVSLLRLHLGGHPHFRLCLRPAAHLPGRLRVGSAQRHRHWAAFCRRRQRRSSRARRPTVQRHSQSRRWGRREVGRPHRLQQRRRPRHHAWQQRRAGHHRLGLVLRRGRVAPHWALWQLQTRQQAQCPLASPLMRVVHRPATRLRRERLGRTSWGVGVHQEGLHHHLLGRRRWCSLGNGGRIRHQRSPGMRNV